MLRASDFKKIARDALHGHWKTAILTGFVAWLIGAVLTSGSSTSFNFDFSEERMDSLRSTLPPDVFSVLLVIILVVTLIALIIAIAFFIISGAGKFGYAKFNLNLIDKKPARFSDLFSQFKRLGDGICMNILVDLFTILWMLLFIVPGIIKAYAYSMTPYICYENPALSVNDAITESRRIMDGNKWRLFCLEFSFIGWELLSAIPALAALPLLFADTAVGYLIWFAIAIPFAFIVQLFVIPYQQAARAAFYREISGPNTTEPEVIQES